MSENDLAHVEEDLRSPCTQKIAFFRAFAQIVERDKNEVVVIDTSPMGILFYSLIKPKVIIEKSGVPKVTSQS